MKNAEKVLDELKTVRPEKLTGEAKRLFEAIMKIADERDELEYKYNRAIEDLVKLEKERQADKEKIKELESDNYECNNIINGYIETIHKIQEEFLKYDWKNSNNEQIYNQLKSLYNEIFKNKAKESGEIDEDNRIIE